MLESFVPDIYQKNIYKIDYDKLYKKGIRCILFDVDNTLAAPNVKEPEASSIKLINDLKDKGFKIVILSNASKHRVEPFKKKLLVDAAAFATKPRREKYDKIMEKFGLKAEEVAAIGDQLLTDVKGANKVGITSIFVNPLSNVVGTLTRVNRFFEYFIFKKLEKKELFIRGRYYE